MLCSRPVGPVGDGVGCDPTGQEAAKKQGN